MCKPAENMERALFKIYFHKEQKEERHNSVFLLNLFTQTLLVKANPVKSMTCSFWSTFIPFFHVSVYLAQIYYDR